MPILPVICRCSGGDNPGPVPKPIRHVSTQHLCMWCPDADGKCKECIGFERVTIRDSNGGLISRTDYAADGKTKFTVPDGCKEGDCAQCPCGRSEYIDPPVPTPHVFPVALCDISGSCETKDVECTSFIRWMTIDTGTGKVETHDTDPDGKEYAVQGTVADCSRCPNCAEETTSCDPVPMCPGLDALDGCQMWELPPGVESVALHVVCGPVFIRTCCGKNVQDVNHEHEIIRIDEPGTTFTWNAPALGCNPGELCPGICIWTGCAEEDGCDGQAYVQYLARCDWDESLSEESESDESWGGYEDPCEEEST